LATCSSLVMRDGVCSRPRLRAATWPNCGQAWPLVAKFSSKN
jgi:hypothetical protein